MDANDVWREGTKRWPEIEVDRAVIARHVDRLADRPAGDACLEEVFLVAACVAGIPTAIAAFDRELIARVPRFVAKIDNSPVFGADVAQLVREKLLVAPFERMLEYSGRGSLASWVRIIANRTGLDLKRRTRADANRSNELANEIARIPRFSEWELLRDQYRPLVETSLKHAVEALPSRDRMVLRLYLIGRKNIAEIGKIFGVHRATVARWIQAAERQILQETVTRLGTEAGISSSECESLARGLISRLDISLEAIL